MSSEPFLPYGRQEVSEADIAAVAAALREPLITQGPLVERFERAFAEQCGAAHAVAFSSGTAALHGAAYAVGVSAGDEVISSPITFAASVSTSLALGATARFVDIDPATWNLDTAAAAGALGERTKLVVPVSFAGLPVDLDPLRDRGVAIVEDACHALGGHRDGAPVGGPGGADITCFSLHPVKAMTTGEGGVATTQDADLAARMRLFRTHGITHEGVQREPDEGAWRYDMLDLGLNYRITDFQCALGLSQLGRLGDWVARRNAIAARYRELLDGDERIALPPAAPAGSLHGYHLFVVHVAGGMAERKRVFEALRAAGIGTQVHYVPVYRLRYYRETLGVAQDDCPHAEAYYAGALSMPMYPGLSDADVERAVDTLRAIVY